jgi:hypothetical protein
MFNSIFLTSANGLLGAQILSQNLKYGDDFKEKPVFQDSLEQIISILHQVSPEI